MKSFPPSFKPAALVRGAAVIAVIGAFNVPVIGPALTHEYHHIKINRSSYERANGHWDVLPVPRRFQVRSIHAALLYTGKVLLIAGSGNDRASFEKGTFKSLLWDPETNRFKLIPTPDDMFCGGHAFLPDGKVLIAGGTRRYEVLKDHVHRAAGVVKASNESPDGPVRLAKGTLFTGEDGSAYRSAEAVTLPRATKAGRGAATRVTASRTELWVTATRPGRASVALEPQKLSVAGLDPARAGQVYGQSEALTLDKQEYQGTDKSYLFDPATERYERVSNMTLKRWYPTLVGLKDGRVLAVSGLDGFGRIIEGHNEIYDPATRRWTAQEQLRRTFPTYPSLFLLPGRGNRLFYSGSNAGYGSPDVGRVPGIWNLDHNTFQAVPGLRDPDETESSGSLLLPPAQRERYMIVGGGGVGESHAATGRLDVADLRAAAPRFTPAGRLPDPTRYPNLVITPDDEVAITGGSSDYRGRGDSNLLICHLYDPRSGRLQRVADPTVGRNYHSEALLLPDGRIVTMGSDSLYNKTDTAPGTFEKRIEIYSPPYLFHGARPVLGPGPTQLQRGGTATFAAKQPSRVRTARLMRPSAVTHVTDVEQRSIALPLERTATGVRLHVPRDAGLVPAGWYMLFVTDGKGTPSVARWVHVA